MTTGKTIALARRTFVGKVMSLLLNMLSRLVIIFFQEQVSSNFMAAQSSSAVILELTVNLVLKNIFSHLLVCWFITNGLRKFSFERKM